MSDIAKDFSRIFQEKMQEKEFYTGNQNAQDPKKFGMRLKILTPNYTLKFLENFPKKEGEEDQADFDSIVNKNFGDIEKLLKRQTPSSNPKNPIAVNVDEGLFKNNYSALGG